MADAKTGDALWKWILGGIAAGAAILGLLIVSYAIGYNRGEDNAAAPAETMRRMRLQAEPTRSTR